MAPPNTGVGQITNLVTAAYDRHLEFALRSTPQFRAVANRKPVAQTHPGSSVRFDLYPTMAQATTALSDDAADPTGVSLADTTNVTVTLEEYGNWTKITNKLQKFNYDRAFDSDVANIIAYNQVDSVDAVVRVALDAGTQVITEEAGVLVDSITGTPTVGNITATDDYTAKLGRFAVAKLRGANVQTFDGTNYCAFIHPDVAHDLRAATGSGEWLTPHEYVDPAGIYAGEIGTFNGIRYIETPRTRIGADEGAGSTVDVYNTYVLGKDALAEAVAEEFHVVLDGTVVDALSRYTPIGWYGIAGWSLYRPESMWLVKTASTIGDNA